MLTGAIVGDPFVVSRSMYRPRLRTRGRILLHLSQFLLGRPYLYVAARYMSRGTLAHAADSWSTIDAFHRGANTHSSALYLYSADRRYSTPLDAPLSGSTEFGPTPTHPAATHYGDFLFCAANHTSRASRLLMPISVAAWLYRPFDMVLMFSYRTAHYRPKRPRSERPSPREPTDIEESMGASMRPGPLDLLALSHNRVIRTLHWHASCANTCMGHIIRFRLWRVLYKRANPPPTANSGLGIVAQFSRDQGIPAE